MYDFIHSHKEGLIEVVQKLASGEEVGFTKDQNNLEETCAVLITNLYKNMAKEMTIHCYNHW